MIRYPRARSIEPYVLLLSHSADSTLRPWKNKVQYYKTRAGIGNMSLFIELPRLRDSKGTISVFRARLPPAHLSTIHDIGLRKYTS